MTEETEQLKKFRSYFQGTTFTMEDVRQILQFCLMRVKEVPCEKCLDRYLNALK